MKKSIQWLMPVLICICASLASVFAPILIYVYPDGNQLSLDLGGFLNPSEALLDILTSYSGPISTEITIVLFALLGVLVFFSIVAAAAGIILIGLRFVETWQFVLAMAGMAGIAMPPIVIMIMVLLSQEYLPGYFMPGVFPMITPIAIALCMVFVAQKYKRTKLEIWVSKSANGLMCSGGDL